MTKQTDYTIAVKMESNVLYVSNRIHAWNYVAALWSEIPVGQVYFPRANIWVINYLEIDCVYYYY